MDCVNRDHQIQGPGVSRQLATYIDALGTHKMLVMASKNKYVASVILVAGAIPLIGTIIGLARIIYGHSLASLAGLEPHGIDRNVKYIIAHYHRDHGYRELIPGYLLYKIFKLAYDDAQPNPHPKREEFRQFINGNIDKMNALEKTIIEMDVKDPMQLPQWKEALVEMHNAHETWYYQRLPKYKYGEDFVRDVAGSNI